MASCERSACLRRERLVGSATSVGRVVARALCQPNSWLGSSHSPSSPPPSCSSALPAAAGTICPTGCDGQQRLLVGLGGSKSSAFFASSLLRLPSHDTQAKQKNSPLPWRVFTIANQHTLARHNIARLIYINLGTPDRSRTYNLLLRTEPLYPVELPGHGYSIACYLL